MYETLKSVYSGKVHILVEFNYLECEWKEEWFQVAPSQPRGFWKSRDNERKFLDDLGAKLGIKNWKGWGVVTNQRFIELDGKTLINKYGSLYQALVNVYSGWETFSLIS